MSEKITLQPGINTFLFKHLGEKAASMRKLQRLCYLTWGEVALQPHIDYDMKLDRLIGFKNDGKDTTSKIADTALLFMVRGINKSCWKLPVAFYFSDGQTRSSTLVAQIKEVVHALATTSLKLVAFVYDTATSNTKAINTLIRVRGCSDGTIPMFGFNIIPLYDPPHLIKDVRNNLLTNDLEMDYKVEREQHKRRYASWKIITLAYQMAQISPPFRPLSRITDDHIYPSGINKMRVKNAAQVLSYTMAAFINHNTYHLGPTNTVNGPLKMPVVEGRTTAEAVDFFNSLFDSVNGHLRGVRSSLCTTITRTSTHHKFWVNAISKIENMRFVQTSREDSTLGSVCLKNWVATIRGFQKLTKVLQENGLLIFRPRHVNKDLLENLFESLKSLGFTNNKLSCAEFINNLKTLLSTNLTMEEMEEREENCETSCDGSLLFTLPQFIIETNQRISEENFANCDIPITILTCDEEPQADEDPNSQTDDVLKMIGPVNYRCCNMDKNDILNSHSRAVAVLTEHMPIVCFQEKIVEVLQAIVLLNIDIAQFGCQDHNCQNVQTFSRELTTSFVKKWCSRVNSILAGEIKRSDCRTSLDIYAYNKSTVK